MHSGLILLLSSLHTKFDYKISTPISVSQWRTAFTAPQQYRDWKLAESAGWKNKYRGGTKPVYSGLLMAETRFTILLKLSSDH